MRTIYKYEIPINFKFAIELPISHDVLSVQLQDGKPFMWVLIDTESRMMNVGFELVLTGFEIDNLSDLVYIDTFQIERLGKIFVYHLFERRV